mmetsp:Transcript_7336/g.24228  ORF Transcript_7336/g.24228 Transcript_7336/m.24228 type:complete len:207 (+) Transcript_7336:67-687(+)
MLARLIIADMGWANDTAHTTSSLPRQSGPLALLSLLIAAGLRTRAGGCLRLKVSTHRTLPAPQHAPRRHCWTESRWKPRCRRPTSEQWTRSDVVLMRHCAAFLSRDRNRRTREALVPVPPTATMPPPRRLQAALASLPLALARAIQQINLEASAQAGQLEVSAQARRAQRTRVALQWERVNRPATTFGAIGFCAARKKSWMRRGSP